MKKVLEIVGLVLLAVLLVIICFGISGLVIMWVWNALAHYFGFKSITFIIGLLIAIGLSVVGGFFKGSTK